MKVTTDLRSGNVLTDAAQEVDQIAQQVSAFVADAGSQADNFTSEVTQASTSLWNSLTNLFR